MFWSSVSSSSVTGVVRLSYERGVVVHRGIRYNTQGGADFSVYNLDNSEPSGRMIMGNERNAPRSDGHSAALSEQTIITTNG